jgi:hypothetical protein
MDTCSPDQNSETSVPIYRVSVKIPISRAPIDQNYSFSHILRLRNNGIDLE